VKKISKRRLWLVLFLFLVLFVLTPGLNCVMYSRSSHCRPEPSLGSRMWKRLFPPKVFMDGSQYVEQILRKSESKPLPASN